MRVVAGIPADPQAAERVQVSERASLDTALSARTGAVLGTAVVDQRLHTEIRDRTAVLVVIVAAVAQHHVPPAPGPAAPAPHRRHRFEQRDELGDIVAVATGQGGGQRRSGGVGDQVVLAAGSALRSTGLRPVLEPPFIDRMWEPSTAAPEKSRALALRSPARRTSCSRGHTSASGSSGSITAHSASSKGESLEATWAAIERVARRRGPTTAIAALFELPPPRGHDADEA